MNRQRHVPDPRYPHNPAWDGPPAHDQPRPLCSYTELGDTVVFDPDNPLAWVELAGHAYTRHEWR